MSASGVRMTTRQIYGSGPARGDAPRDLAAQEPPCAAAAAIAILLMLAGLRLQTDSETMDRKGDAWFRVGERVTFLTGENSRASQILSLSDKLGYYLAAGQTSP